MPAIFIDAIDIHLRGADHKIDVIQADVTARSNKFFVVQLFTANQCETVCAPNGNMAGGILIEKCVVEEVPAPGNGGAGWDERNFTETSRPIIGVNQFFQDRFVLLCVDFDNPAILEGHAEI